LRVGDSFGHVAKVNTDATFAAGVEIDDTAAFAGWFVVPLEGLTDQ
jgi:hypothetical protein